MSGEFYLTPETIPATTLCRVLIIPDDANMLAAVNAALLGLTFENNWVQGTGVTPSQAATAGQTLYDNYRATSGPCMTAQIVGFAGDSIPAGWLECDGSTHLRTDWPNLYATLDTIFIVDADHFVVPDLRGRSIVGVGSGPGLTTRAMGDVGGEEAHVLTVAELASHTHTDTGHTHVEGTATPAVGAAITGVPVPSAVPSVGVTGSGSAVITNTGSGTAHNTMHPFLAVRYIIQAF